MSQESTNRDIKYYIEILRKANLIEAQDPILCYSLLWCFRFLFLFGMGTHFIFNRSNLFSFISIYDSSNQSIIINNREH
jgi:hypothetical protein